MSWDGFADRFDGTYFDMECQPMSLRQWSELFESSSQIEPGQPGSRFLAQEDVELPGGDHAHVSTVWLGIDHNMFGKVPHIFETMIFWQAENYGSEDYCVRTPTREAALAEHDQACEWARNLGQLPAGYRITEDSSPRDEGGDLDG